MSLKSYRDVLARVLRGGTSRSPAPQPAVLRARRSVVKESVVLRTLDLLMQRVFSFGLALLDTTLLGTDTKPRKQLHVLVRLGIRGSQQLLAIENRIGAGKVGQ